MIRDYQLVSPSLEGVLSSSTLSYEGIERPAEVLRVLDGPSAKGSHPRPHSPEEAKVLSDYFQDLHGIFMKKLSHFVVESEFSPSDTIKLQAMLQEMIKIKKLIREGVPAIQG